MFKKMLIVMISILLTCSIVNAENNNQQGMELNTFVVEITDGSYLLADVNNPTSHYYMPDDLVKETLEIGDMLTGYGKASPNEIYPRDLIFYDYQIIDGQIASEEDIQIARESSPREQQLSWLLEEWGDILYEYSDRIPDENDDIKCIDEDELNRTIEFYKLRGDENPEELALKYVSENQALYIEAVDKGFEVTDDDVLINLAMLKEQLESMDNDQEYEIMKEQFPSDEEYWRYQFIINKKSMVVDAYLEQKGRELVEQNFLDIHSPDFQDDWAVELQIIKDELVEKHFPGNLTDYVK